MDPSLNAMAKERQRAGKLTILVGNSGDRSNQHIAALRAVYQQFGDTVNVVVPMGYPANNQTILMRFVRPVWRYLAPKIYKFLAKNGI